MRLYLYTSICVVLCFRELESERRGLFIKRGFVGSRRDGKMLQVQTNDLPDLFWIGETVRESFIGDFA